MEQITNLKKEKKELKKQMNELKKRKKQIRKEENEERRENCTSCCLSFFCCCCCCFRRQHLDGASPFVMDDVQNYNQDKKQLDGKQTDLQEQLKRLNEKINVLERQHKKKSRCC